MVYVGSNIFMLRMVNKHYNLQSIYIIANFTVSVSVYVDEGLKLNILSNLPTNNMAF